MKLHHLNILCDPHTKEDLTLDCARYDGDEIVEGTLISKTNQYPIKNGIPRFVTDEGYSDNFGYQWNRWARVQFEDRNVGGPMENHTTCMFQTITGLTPAAVLDRLVLDIGCGAGRFTDVVAGMGAKVVAVDYSSAIDAAKANFAGKVYDILFLQADALHLPIKRDSIDISFSIGVLHHTPSPVTAVGEAFRVLRTDGTFSLRVYSAGGFYTLPQIQFYRWFFLKIKPILGLYPPLIYAYFFGTLGFVLGRIWRPLSYPLRAVFPTAFLPDHRWAVLDTFDAVATTHQSGHTPKEIDNWLHEAGFVNVQQRQGNDFVGRK